MTGWALVMAERGDPGHDRMLALAAAFADRGLRVGGFVQQTETIEGGRHYVARSLAHAVRVHLARRGGRAAAGEEVYCNCALSPAGFEQTEAWLDADLGRSDVVIIDGLGRFEAAGLGHAAGIRRALRGGAVPVLSVRPDQLAPIMERFGLGEPRAILERQDPLGAFVDAVADCGDGATGTAGETCMSGVNYSR